MTPTHKDTVEEVNWYPHEVTCIDDDVCEQCGALVHDIVAHIEFHAALQPTQPEEEET